MSCCFLKNRYTAAYSRDTTTIYFPPYLLYASFPSRHTPPHPLLPLPSIQTTSNMSTSEEAAYSEQAEVFHSPQPGCPRDRESSLEIPGLETGGTTRGGFRCRDRRRSTIPQSVPTNQEAQLAGSRGEVKTDKPPPESGASRRQLSPAPGVRHQLPPCARQGTTAATWALRARQNATPRAPGTGALMPHPWTWHTRRRGPRGRSTTPTRR